MESKDDLMLRANIKARLLANYHQHKQRLQNTLAKDKFEVAKRNLKRQYKDMLETEFKLRKEEMTKTAVSPGSGDSFLVDTSQSSPDVTLTASPDSDHLLDHIIAQPRTHHVTFTEPVVTASTPITPEGSVTENEAHDGRLEDVHMIDGHFDIADNAGVELSDKGEVDIIDKGGVDIIDKDSVGVIDTGEVEIIDVGDEDITDKDLVHISEQDKECVCNRPIGFIRCTKCLVMWEGRSAVECPRHPRRVNLMDFAYCIRKECKSQSLRPYHPTILPPCHP